VLQQPTNAGGALDGVDSPTQDVAQRRNSSRDPVDVDAKTMQQFKGGEIARSRSNVH
jgi:hypothetical protein